MMMQVLFLAYLGVAIAELVDEAMKAAGRPHYQFSQQWDAGSMAQADVIFTEMVAGEWYLCQDLFQHAPEQYLAPSILHPIVEKTDSVAARRPSSLHQPVQQ